MSVEHLVVSLHKPVSISEEESLLHQQEKRGWELVAVRDTGDVLIVYYLKRAKQ